MDDPAAPPFVRAAAPFWWVTLFVVVANLMVLVLVGLSLEGGYRQYRQRAEISSRNTNRLVSQSIAGDIERIDLGLRSVADEVARQRAEGSITVPVLDHFLTRLQARLPMTESVRVTDAQGTIIAGSGGVPPAFTAADRDYFIALRANPALDLAISRPLVGRISGLPVVIFARRLVHPAGGFGGVVYAPVPIAWFVDQFASLEVGEHGVVVMRGDASRDFDVLARFPAAGFVGQTSVSDTFRALFATHPRGGTYQAKAGIDDVLRTFSYQAVGKFPLLTVVGLATQDYIGDWWREVARQAALAAIFLLVTVLAGRMTLRSWRKLEQRTDELARSNADLEQFAYVASHDLQTPLRNMVSYTQLLSRRYHGRLDADADQFLDFIVDSGKRLSAMITDLLDYARISKVGGATLAVPAGQVVEAVLAQLKPLAEDAHITVGPLPTVLAEPPQMYALFHNLIHNGLTYRHPERRPEIDITASSEGESMWRFAVRDNGIGIDKDYFEKIFTIFQRLEPVRFPGGTGIGLAACRRIVQRHGGRIWVESELGRGATVYFTLPAA